MIAELNVHNIQEEARYFPISNFCLFRKEWEQNFPEISFILTCILRRERNSLVHLLFAKDCSLFISFSWTQIWASPGMYCFK